MALAGFLWVCVGLWLMFNDFAGVHQPAHLFDFNSHHIPILQTIGNGLFEERGEGREESIFRCRCCTLLLRGLKVLQNPLRSQASLAGKGT